jgi:L-iditol 2-dehydrogenase
MDMRAILVRQVGAFEVTRVPLRDPLEDEVIVRVEVTGLCRTDLKLIRVGHRDLTLPRVPGEEVVGTVWKRGRHATSFTEGERVYVYPGIWCDTCPTCLQGAQNLCKEMQIMGFHRDGGFAEYVIVPEKSLIPVPCGLSPDMAVFAEPLSCCLNALELAGLKEAESIGIWGAGPAGTLLARASMAMGARPFSFDPDAVRCERINGGEAYDGREFDVCIVAVGSKSAYEEALQALKPRGRLVVFSGLSPKEDQMPVSFNQLHYHEQTIVGAYGCSYRHGGQALGYIASGAVPVEDLVSHRMPLEDLQSGLEIVENRKGMKVLLYP